MTNDTLRALYVLAADYHSGQGSRGYRLLCRASRLLNRRAFQHPALPIYSWSYIRQSAAYRKYQPMAERYF